MTTLEYSKVSIRNNTAVIQLLCHKWRALCMSTAPPPPHCYKTSLQIAYHSASHCPGCIHMYVHGPMCMLQGFGLHRNGLSLTHFRQTNRQNIDDNYHCWGLIWCVLHGILNVGTCMRVSATFFSDSESRFSMT